ncbi:MAG TPA: oligoendopeptidase, partial [Bacillales bacterium]|nr:oligoendopeptidase [Bacillales bacterium]
MKLQGLDQTWNLENFFPGGSGSEAFSRYLQQIASDLTSLHKKVNEFPVLSSVEEADKLADLMVITQDLSARLHESSAFISCLVAQNVNDQRAVQLRGKLRELGAALSTVHTIMDHQLTEIADGVWEELLEKE